MSPDPRVVALCPIRNRAWIVEEHSASIVRQTQRLFHPKTLAGIFYLTGDNVDDTVRRLEWLRALPGSYLHYEEFDTGSPYWSRSREGEKYTTDNHSNLARVYNKLLDRGLALFPEASHFWLLDSDVLPEEECLEELLRVEEDVVAAVVEHRAGSGVYNFISSCNEALEPRRSGMDRKLVDGFLGGGAFQVAFVSCCVLYRREVLEGRAEPLPSHVNEEGIGVHESGFQVRRPRFAPHPRSHDFPWVADLKRAGYELWVAPQAKAEHVMEER